ncbi:MULTISPECIES: hypothetical protein [unclassified Nocardiopsis]|uniref:hypothetical protein n=1 Tax=unclassified Nocardiopsis TaxID=2649073 RepID=UPI00135CC434|nr:MULTISPECIES: hypothetical protein [unclassified Nocardiopsis]
MSHPSRPTFDPALPPRVVARLRAHPEKLRPASAGRSRRPSWRQGAALTAAGCTSLAAVALLSPTAGVLLLLLLCLGTTAAVLGLVSLGNSFTDDWTDLVMHAFWALPAAAAGVLGARLLLGPVVGPLEALVPGDPATAALYLAAAAGGSGAIMRPGMVSRLAAENADRYVLPEDFGRRYGYAARREEPEAHLFARLQQATDRVEEGQRVLGASFDAGHTLPLLREEEWRLARELLRLRSLREELVRRRREAVSEQVTRALQPQEEAVARAHAALAERIAVLAGYGERVHAAVTAHREWEQCQEIADRAADYADLALSSSRDTVHTEELDESLLSVEAAHSVREELVRKAVDAGSSLTEALRRGSDGGQSPPGVTRKR